MNPTYEILKRLGAVEFEGWDVQQAAIRYPRFLAILMTPDSSMISYGSERTVRDKWRLLQAMGFAKRVNQGDTVRFDINVVKSFMQVCEANQ